MTAGTSIATPLYQGIVEDMRGQISSGQLRPGDQILSIGELIDRYRVSAITAKRAVSELQNMGLVWSIKGKGTFVSRSFDTGNAKAGAAPMPVKSVALLTSNLDARRSRSFFNEIWENIEIAAEDAGLGFRVQIVPDGTPDHHMDLMLRPDPSEGLIFLAAMHPYRVLPLLTERSLPTVIVDSALSFCNSVLTDNLAGMALLIDHLRALGHRRILLAARHQHSPNATNENERIAAFNFLTRDRGLEGNVVAAEDSRDLIRRVRARHGPTAVMFTQDDPALEFTQKSREAGLSVPHDVSVTGFDGWTHTDNVAPQLTTLRVDRAEMGRQAVKFLRQPHIPDRLNVQWIRVPGQFIAGQTTARPHRS